MIPPSWRYYLRFYEGSYGWLLLSIATSMVQSFILVPIALLVRYGFDRVIPAGDVYHLGLVGGAILILYFTDGGAMLWTRHITLRETKKVIQRLRDDLLKKAYTFSRSYYTEADRSKLHTILVHDTERLDVMSNALVAQFVPSLITTVVLGAVLLHLNWFLFLLMAGIVPLLYLINRGMKKAIKERTRTFHRSFETFSKGILFVLQMMDLTRIQSAERFEMERQRKFHEDLRLTSGSMAWLHSVSGLVQDTVVASSGVMILIVGGGAVAAGRMTLGELMSFFVVIGLLKGYLHTLSFNIPQVIAGHESLATLYGLSRIEARASYTGTRRIRFSGKITLSSVMFQYHEQPVLHEINLRIDPHSIAAIVGPNGAGKSTIVNLILGFYRPQKGGLYADDRPYSDLDLIDLRRQIGVVMQDPILFPGTVSENVAYGYPEATLEQISEAAAKATAQEFIRKLPKGYDTQIGDNGVLLSGGQRQRLAIARAVLRQPALLILDEPTNHLDDSTASQVMNNLQSAAGMPSILIISHDPIILRQTPLTYTLQGGRIVESRGGIMPDVENRGPAGFF